MPFPLAFFALPILLYGIKIGASVIAARYALMKAKSKLDVNLTKEFITALCKAVPHAMNAVVARTTRAYYTLQDLKTKICQKKVEAEGSINKQKKGRVGNPDEGLSVAGPPRKND